MTDKLVELEHDAVREKKDIEEKAFELYVKDCIMEQLNNIDKAQERLDRATSYKNEKTMEEYRETFKTGVNHANGTRNKDYYIDLIKDQYTG